MVGLPPVSALAGPASCLRTLRCFWQLTEALLPPRVYFPLCCRQQQGGYGSRQPRYAAYSAYGDIEQPHRRRSYDEAFDRDGYGYGRQYGGGGGGDWGGGKRPRR